MSGCVRERHVHVSSKLEAASDGRKPRCSGFLRQMRNIGDVLDPEVQERRRKKIEEEEQRKEAREARRRKK